MAVIGAEKHFSGVGMVLKLGTKAAPATKSFKNLDVTFSIPSKYTLTEDAGLQNGNVIRVPEVPIDVNFTLKVTTTQMLEQLQLIFNEGAEFMSILEEGATVAVDEHKFHNMTANLDFSQAEVGNTVSFSVQAAGWEQGAATYGFLDP